MGTSDPTVDLLLGDLVVFIDGSSALASVFGPPPRSRPLSHSRPSVQSCGRVLPHSCAFVASPQPDLDNSPMFGVYRYILAVLIVFSHIRPSMPFQFGAAAFVGLFLLSGYLTTYLIRNHYGHFGRTTAFFYLDRILRLYPQFLLFLALTLVADIALKLPESSFRGGATVARVFLNALIVPANYAAFLPNLRVYILIPAMWSLALLAQAYGLFPFLVLRPWVNRMAAALSLILFTLAVFGALPTPFFALRFLPSVLFIFILGKSWAEFQLTREREPLIITSALYLSVLILLVVVLNTQFIDVSYNLEVLAGLAAAGPLIAALSLRQRKKWDEFLGRAA